MIFKKVLEAVELIRVKRSDSDHIDRLNHRWTSILLVVSCLLLTTANYGSLPMFCWCPAYFVSAYEKYAQKICWVSESYNIVDDRSQNFPAASRGGEEASHGGYYYSAQPQQQYISPEGKKVLRVSYYQWIPLLLLMQSFFFYLPGLIWKTLAARSGLDLANIVEASDTVQNAIYPERREKTLRYMSRHINRFLTFQNNYRGGCCRCFRGVFRWRWCFCCGNKFGNYLSSLYLGLKLVNLANIVVQVLFIDFYLGSHFHLLGLAFIHGLSTNQTIAMVTAIASNHPLMAHQGNNVYSSHNPGSMVKRDLGRVDLDSLVANESVFTASGIDIATVIKPGQEGPEFLRNESIFKSNGSDFSNNKINHSTKSTHTKARRPIVDDDTISISKPTNRSRRDERRTNERHYNSQKHRKQRRPTGSYDWSTYMASLTSFPYLSSKLFPKITYCDFTVHQMTTIQLFTTQCVLSINFINEKLFLLLWFWFCLLFLINIYSITIWSVTLCLKSSRENYIRRQLAMIQRRLFLESAQYDRQPLTQPPIQYPSSSYRPSVVESTLAERKIDMPTTTADDSDDKATEIQPLQSAPINRRLVKFEESLTIQEHQELSYEQAVKSFVHCRLKQDGVFILKILATNTTRLVELDVLALLWSVHERRLATSDPYYTSDRRESLVQPSSERRDTIVDVTELRRAKAALSEREL